MKKLLPVIFAALSLMFGASNAIAQAPTTAASGITTAGTSTTSISVNWTNGNGSRRLVTCSPAASATAYPANGNAYTASTTYGSGFNLGSSNYCVYNGTSTGVTIFGLSSGTQYTVRIYEYNTVSSFEYYLSSHPTYYEYTLALSPTTQVTSLNATSIGTASAYLSWTSGSGTNDLIAVRAATAYLNTPVDGTDYYAYPVFGSGDYITGTSPYPYVVYDGTLSAVTVSGLTPGTTYTAAGFTYNGLSGANNYYLTGSPAKTFTTLAAEPTSTSYSVAFSNVTDNSMTVSWTPPTSGGGTYRIVTCKAGSASTDIPVDATYYIPGATYGSGNLIGSSYVVYNGYGNYVNVTGLSGTTTYYFSVFEYNVSTNTYNNTYNYLTTPATGSQQTLTNEPTMAASGLAFSNITSSSVRASWANGNGARRIAGVAAGRRQTALALDGTNDYVSIPNESKFDFTNNMTVEAWIKVNSFSVADQAIITKGDEAWKLTRNGSTNALKFSFTYTFFFTSTYTVSGTRNVNDGKWHHVAATYNGSQMILYVDGTLDAYASASASIDNTSSQVWIGANSQVPGQNFNGKIDEVRIWNTAQSNASIRSNMNKTLVGNELGLVGYWKLDDGYVASVTAKNSSFTTGIDGVVVNAGTAGAFSFATTSGWVYSGAVVNVPLDFNAYLDNTVFMSNASSSFYYGNLYYTVYKGPDSTSVNVTGLSPSTYYTFGVFDYNGVTGNNNYLTDTYAIGEVQTSTITAPTITSFTPASGFVGSVVTINGTGFNPAAAGNTVYFGATKATVLTANAGGTQLTVKVPAGASYSPLSVTNNTLTAYSAKPYIVTSPCGSTAFTAASLNAATAATSYYPVEMRVADMDQDGLPDVVGIFPYYTSITRNTSTSTAVNLSAINYVYNSPASANDLELADFDGDGKVDIVLGNSYNTNGSVIATRNTSTPSNITVAANVEFPGVTGYNVTDIAVADFDTDGKPDVIISYNSYFVSVFKNTSSVGNISFSARAEYYVNTAAVINTIAVADIDGDGKTDVALAGGAGNSIYYLRNTSTTGLISFATYTSTSLSGAITGLAIGDIDTDGKPDVVYGNGTSTVAILKNNSVSGTITIATSATTLAALANTPTDIKLGDLDGDGKLDITVGYTTGTQISIYKNTSTASISVAAKNDFTITASSTNPVSVGVYDMNGDSKSDVLATNSGASISYFQNNINALGAEPTVQASNLTFSGVTTSQITLTFTPGNGANKVVFVRAATAPLLMPSDGVSYVPNAVYGSGTNLGSGNYCVFDGNGSGVTVTGLMPNTQYIFSVYEYNGLLNCQYNYMPGGTSNNAMQATNNNPPTLNAISNPASICQSSGLQTINMAGISTGSVNETQTLTITATSGNTGLIPNPTVNYTSPNTTGTLTYTPVAGVSGTAVITVTVNDGATNNNILVRTFTVTVDHTPTVSVAGPNQQICPGVATLAGNTPVYGSGTWSIVSTTNPAITITSLTNPTSTVTGFAISDSATFRWTITNGACASSSTTVKVKRNNCPTTADFTASSTSQCLSGSPVITYTDASIAAGATITSWSWNFGAGAFPPSATGAGPHVVTYSTAGSKTISLQVTDNLSATDFEIKTGFVTISDIPDPATNISGSSTVCQGQNTVNYTVPVIPNATGYTWNLPSGASLISGVNTNSVMVNFNSSAVSGNISVRGTNACGNGALSANFAVSVNPLPAAAGTITPGTTNICDGASGVVFSVPSIANALSYSWTLPGGATIIGATNTNSITVNFTPGLTDGTISVAGVNACGNGVPSNLNFTVNPYPGIAGAIAGQSSITACPVTSGVTYSIPLADNATSYNWSLPAGASIVSGAGTNSITVDYAAGAVSGDIIVMPMNGCGNGTSSALPVVVNTLPDVAGIITGSDTISVCPVSNGILYTVAPVFNADHYIWSVPAGATIVSGDSTNTITVSYNDTAASGTINVYGENACGAGVTSSLAVYVTAVPTQELCMVSVDTSSTFNVITWEKPVSADIDSFRIYREVLTSFVHIGTVAYDSLSEYIDNTYLPAADPNTTNFRYKISIVDTCGNESDLSNHHRTIFLQANQGVGGVVNLNWVPYEGATVDFYRILRDTTGVGTFEAIDSVTGSTTVYTDLAPAFSSANVRYMLESNWSISCSPTRATVNTSRSNIKHVGLIATGSIEQEILNTSINVYPNPADDKVTIQYPAGFKRYQLQMFDALGQLVVNEQLNDDGAYNGTLTHQLDVSAFTKGVYIVNIQTEYGSSFKRLVIQ